MALDRYYNLFDPAAGHTELMFRAGDGLQSRELNELQTWLNHRIGGLAGAIFKDGDIMRDAQITVNADTGAVRADAGLVYVRGAVRPVAAASFTIPPAGRVAVGVRYRERIVTELEDAALRDPAVGTRNYQEPGAARRLEMIAWGWAGESNGDEGEGDFHAVYTVVNGVVQSKSPPPQIDGVAQAIAHYDRDNSGGTYVVSGYRVYRQPNLPTGEQVFVVASGRARINGYPVEHPADSRVIYPAVPDLREVDAEPHLSAGGATQRVNTDRFPIAAVQEVQITAQKTVTLVHGSVSGSADPLPDTSVLEIVAVNQGGVWNGTAFTDGTSYAGGTDYRLWQGKVDWSLAGSEIATGSTYSVTYKYVKTIPGNTLNKDDTGFTVESGVAGTLILVTYTAKLPRVDRLCLSTDSEFVWVEGVAADYNPVPPVVPPNLLPIATVVQNWQSSGATVVSDAVRMVPMNEIAAINGRLDLLTDLIARQNLIATASVRESGIKKGMLVDPFTDDSVRDLGIAQNAAVINGVLTLPVTTSASFLKDADTQPQHLTPTYSIALEQTERSGGMKVNPYMSFPPRPAEVSLVPAQDFWTETVVQNIGTEVSAQTITTTNSVTSRIGTNYFYGYGSYETVVGQYSTTATTGTTSSSATRSVGSVFSTNIENLRQIDVNFTVAGFGPGKTLTAVRFDGIAVVPAAA